MKVRSGAVVQGRSIEVEITEDDISDDWKNLSPQKKFSKMSAFVDILVVSYMHGESLLTPEQSTKRLTNLKKKLDA